MRGLWLAADAHVRTCDMVAMATQRLRLALPEEATLSITDPFTLTEEELPMRKIDFESDINSAKQSLRKALGQILYLQNLAKADGEGQRGVCPICCIDLVDQVSRACQRSTPAVYTSLHSQVLYKILRV